MIIVNGEPVDFTEYPNGETVVPDIHVTPGDTVVRLAWESDVDLVRLVLVRGLLSQKHCEQVRLVIDYMPYSRMDREEDGHCFSLAYIAELIRSLRWHSIRVVEPHSDETIHQLRRASDPGTDVQPIWATATLLPQVMDMISFDREHDYIVLPDKGAFARYSGLAADVLDNCNVIVMGKIRDFETGRIRGLTIDRRVVRGQHAEPTRGKGLIIDDLSSRGGTFIQTASVLRGADLCRDVSLLVTHMENVGFTGELKNVLNRVFCADTMPVPGLIPNNFYVFPRSAWL